MSLRFDYPDHLLSLLITAITLLVFWRRFAVWLRIAFVPVNYLILLGIFSTLPIGNLWALSAGAIVSVILLYGLVYPCILRRFQKGISQRPKGTMHPSPTVSNVMVHWQPDMEKVETTTEEIYIPPGVTITVKRSRTVEHTININWGASRGGNVDIGLQQIISGSIRGEIEQSQGRTYQQSETIEYEVELNGDTSNRYRLTWADIWRKGVVEIGQGSNTRMLPFQFRERAELQVAPLDISSKAA